MGLGWGELAVCGVELRSIKKYLLGTQIEFRAINERNFDGGIFSRNSLVVFGKWIEEVN